MIFGVSVTTPPSNTTLSAPASAIGVGFTSMTCEVEFAHPLVPVNVYVIECDPAPAVAGLNKPVAETPGPVNVPVPGMPFCSLTPDNWNDGSVLQIGSAAAKLSC